MFDREVLRDQQLIEERIEYENDFIDIDEIIKSGELDVYTTPQFEEYYDYEYSFDAEYVETELDLEFDFEDYCDRIHDEQLIEMYEAQIKDYLEIDENISEYDPLEAAIEDLELPSEPDYEYFDEFDDYYVEEIPMDAAYCGGQLIGYVVGETNFCDYDYPEGPDENLQGFRFGEPDYIEPYDCEMHDIDYPDDFYGNPEPEYQIANEHGEYLFDIQEECMQKMINDRINEENEFFKFVKECEVKDEYFLPIGCEDIILC